MRTLAIAAMLAGIIGISVSVQSLAAASSPVAFMNEFYDHYRNGRATDLNPWAEPERSRVFDPGMVNLMKEDAKLLKSAKVEMSNWQDADQFCECQDSARMKAPVTLISATATAALVSVDIARAGQAPQVLRIKLVTVGSQWRVADVISSRGDSLRADIIKDIADTRKLLRPHS